MDGDGTTSGASLTGIKATAGGIGCRGVNVGLAAVLQFGSAGEGSAVGRGLHAALLEAQVAHVDAEGRGKHQHAKRDGGDYQRLPCFPFSHAASPDKIF
jgi:hypothetical protein